MTYKFPQFKTEIIDPDIVINPIVNKVDPDSMTIEVDIEMTTASAYFGIALDGVSVNNLNYDADELRARVLTNLEQYIV